MSSKAFRRKDLKHDEFITATGSATQWLLDHRRRIGWALLAVALVVSVVFGVQFAHQRQEQRAAALLASAMDVYRAPVAPPVQEPVVATVARPGEPVAEGSAAQATEADPTVAAAPAPIIVGLQFASEEEKYRAALERFKPIVDRYGSRPSGSVAAFYVGDCQSRLGNMEEAVAAFNHAAEAGRSLVSSMALYRLGQLERERGNADAAVAFFDRLLEDSSSLFPREEALMAKARAHVEAEDPRAALATYERVLDEFGNSYSAVEARNHAAELTARLGLDPGVEGD